ncbi:MAG TPA: tRNA epoxyqueuosine(34) reductase QueG [Rubricoccaceae bacterium]|jgi:epoxyqueuosine reductase
MPGYDPARLAADLKADALRLGFDGVGIARAERLDVEARRLDAWLTAGRHGGSDGAMTWMERNFDKRIDPRELVPGAQSVVSVFASYWQNVPAAGSAAPGTGAAASARIARYAWGDDYHDVLKEKLAELFDVLDRRVGGAGGRAFVDSAPVMDKAWAQRAGLGWQGKNTNLLTRSHGSFVFLGELITDVPLAPDAPFTADHCGSCTRCLDACPTGALDAPYQIDAERCISYWTIEHRGETLPEIAKQFGTWAFGCDVCQEVCPWTRFSQPTRDARFLPRPGTPDTPLRDWAELDLEGFRERFRKSPVKRSKFEGWARNVRQAIENAERGDAG